VRARTPGFETAREEPIAGPGRRPVVIALQRLRALEGRVLDAQGAPLPSATVHVERPDAPGRPVDASGRFRVEEVPELSTFHVRAPAHVARSFAARLPLADLEVRLERAAPPIRGRVAGWPGPDERGEVHAGPPGAFVYRETIEAPASAPPPPPAPGSVWDLPTTIVSTTIRRDGTFALDGLPGGPVELRAHRPFDARGRADPGDLDVVLERVVPPPQWRDVPVRVLAVADESGATLEELTRWQGGQGDERWVTIGAPGRVPIVFHVRLLAGSLDLGTLRLALAGEVRVRVRWPDAPVLGIEASWGDGAGWASIPDLSDPAPWTLTGLAPGRTSLSFEARCWDCSEGHRAPPVVVDVVAGRVVEVVLDLTEVVPLHERW
jgi:hypothetical protein